MKTNEENLCDEGKDSFPDKDGSLVCEEAGERLMGVLQQDEDEKKSTGTADTPLIMETVETRRSVQTKAENVSDERKHSLVEEDNSFVCAEPGERLMGVLPEDEDENAGGFIDATPPPAAPTSLQRLNNVQDDLQTSTPGAIYFFRDTTVVDDIVSTVGSDTERGGTEPELDPIPAVLFDEAAEQAHRQRRIKELTARVRDNVFQELIQTLPHAEEVDRNVGCQSQERESSADRRTFLKRIAFIVVTSAAICSILATFLTAHQNQNSDSPSRKEQIFDLLLPISGNTLQNKSTDQYRAFDWIVNEDPMQLESHAAAVVERYVLVLLFFATGGPSNWTDSCGFLSNTSVCNWQDELRISGVFCYPSGSVFVIRMIENNLYGTLPHELSALHDLQEIILPRNFLHATIPSSLKDSRYLRKLTLTENNLHGPLPDLSNVRDLQNVELFDNFLSGTIPMWLTTRMDLQSLTLAWNLFSGTIPQFEHQVELERLDLGNNMLTGSIPSSIGSLTSLEILALAGNQLTGTVTTYLGQLSSLTMFVVSGNQLSGFIPSELGKLMSLHVLYLFDNRFHGSIPSELGSLTNLNYLYLQSNHLTGSVPPEMALLENLVELFIHHNNISGNLSDVCYPSSPEIEGLMGTNLFTADCLARPKSEIHCPCCSHCCSDLTGLCEANYENQFRRCKKKAMELEASSIDGRGTVCSCANGGQSIFCRDTKCQYCNRDGSICYVDSEPGIMFDLVRQSFSVSIQYVKGRNEHVFFQYDAVDDLCIGGFNGQPCKSCQPVYCTDGFHTFEIDCSNLGHGVRSACRSGDDPFYDAWDIINYLLTFEMQLPMRFDCVPLR